VKDLTTATSPTTIEATTTATAELEEDEDLKSELNDCIICPKIFELNELLQVSISPNG
jgi:hypothetical protein